MMRFAGTLGRRHLVVGIGLAAATATAFAVPATPPASALITGVPHVRQRPDFCGEACVAMALRKLGYAADQDDVFAATGLDPLLGRGAYTRELAKAVEHLGFRAGPVWTYVSPANAEREMGAALEALYADLARGVPSVVCMRFDESPRAPEHFRLVLGFDRARDEIVFHDPAVDPGAGGAYRRMPRARFLRLWPLKYRRDQWTLVRIALDPAGRIDVGQRPAGVTPAALAQHVMAARPKIPAGFITRIVGPFLVIGDEGEAEVERHTQAIAWATSRLVADYGMTPPRQIIDVWLLGTDRSYVANTERLFHESPSTPYGFFLPAERTLIMNIATGGGTLIHEVVHPFIQASFPRCPAWFNEGLASLYERVKDRGGHLWGLPNWRLAGLVRAIRAGRVPSFAAMTAETDAEFYASATGYAQARYLCLYLQEKGVLRRFYADYRDHHAADPTGLGTLARVLDERDLARFQKRWEAWVLTLNDD
jgi:hypothetical protein